LSGGKAVSEGREALEYGSEKLVGSPQPFEGGAGLFGTKGGKKGRGICSWKAYFSFAGPADVSQLTYNCFWAPPSSANAHILFQLMKRIEDGSRRRKLAEGWALLGAVLRV
jgi:hypothetical protein